MMLHSLAKLVARAIAAVLCLQVLCCDIVNARRFDQELVKRHLRSLEVQEGKGNGFSRSRTRMPGTRVKTPAKLGSGSSSIPSVRESVRSAVEREDDRGERVALENAVSKARLKHERERKFVLQNIRELERRTEIGAKAEFEHVNRETGNEKESQSEKNRKLNTETDSKKRNPKPKSHFHSSLPQSWLSQPLHTTKAQLRSLLNSAAPTLYSFCDASSECGTNHYCISCDKCTAQHAERASAKPCPGCDADHAADRGAKLGYCAPLRICPHAKDSVESDCPSTAGGCVVHDDCNKYGGNDKNYQVGYGEEYCFSCERCWHHQRTVNKNWSCYPCDERQLMGIEHGTQKPGVCGRLLDCESVKDSIDFSCPQFSGCEKHKDCDGEQYCRSCDVCVRDQGGKHCPMCPSQRGGVCYPKHLCGVFNDGEKIAVWILNSGSNSNPLPRSTSCMRFSSRYRLHLHAGCGVCCSHGLHRHQVLHELREMSSTFGFSIGGGEEDVDVRPVSHGSWRTL